MRVASLHLENFKGFDYPIDIDLAGCNIYMGENSGGKSTVNQALRLFQQTPMPFQEKLVSLKFRTTDNDLGGYSTVISGHKRDKPLTLGFTIENAPGILGGGVLLPLQVWL